MTWVLAVAVPLALPLHDVGVPLPPLDRHAAPARRATAAGLHRAEGVCYTVFGGPRPHPIIPCFVSAVNACSIAHVSGQDIRLTRRFVSVLAVVLLLAAGVTVLAAIAIVLIAFVRCRRVIYWWAILGRFVCSSLLGAGGPVATTPASRCGTVGCHLPDRPACRPRWEVRQPPALVPGRACPPERGVL